MHHTRSPELAHRSIWRCVRPGGRIIYGHFYLDTLANRRVAVDRNRLQYHKMPTGVAKRKLRSISKLYWMLVNSGLLRLL